MTEAKKQGENPKKKHSFWWWVGVILIWPISLTIWIQKNEKLSKNSKIGWTIGLWVFVLFWFNLQSKNQALYQSRMNAQNQTATSPSSDNQTSENISEPTPTPIPVAQNKKIGEVFNTSDNKLEVSIISMEERTKVGNQYVDAQPAEGGIYIVINWRYKNISDQPIKSYATPTIKLISPTEVQYESDINATGTYGIEKKTNSKILSDLNPGILVDNAKVFEVSKELFSQSGWKLLVRGSGKDILVDLK